MAWSGEFLNKRGIKNICRKQLCDDIFLPLKVENEWKMLIVDDFAMKILSSCFKTEEVIAFNIALIEDISKSREPMPYLSAIYILCPSHQSIGSLQTDFVSTTPKYQNVYLFFLSAVSDELFNGLVKYAKPNFVLAFKEIDFLFLPYESQVFSLNDDRFISVFFDAYKELDINYCMFIAKKLATFCLTLKVWPKIRYRRNFVKNFILAEAIQRELNRHRESSTSSSSTCDKIRCELLILDRGFDCISPVLHEFTFQAMAYDTLNIKDDIFSYSDEETDGEKVNEISLSEEDSLWGRLRHEHIANVSKIIDGMAETDMLLERHPKLSRLKKLPELGEAVKKHLAYKKNQPHAIYRRMANECMKIYCGGINVIAEVEQDLALGLITKSSRDMRSAVMNVLGNDTFKTTDKLRVFLLYIFYSKGITKKEFDDIVTFSKLPFSEARIITNVLHLDVDIFRPGACKSVDYIFKESDDSTSKFKSSRWIPAIKNVMLSCIDGSLSQEKYPYLGSKECETLSPSRRTGYWCSDRKDEYASRLIIFIAGGVTFSELRSAYEIMEKYKGWQIYIGGDSLLTPERFFHKLEELPCFISKDM